MPVNVTAPPRTLRPHRAACLSLILITAIAAQSAAAATACFGPEANSRLSFEVYQLAPPPAPGRAVYSFYPLTAAATMQLGRLRADRFGAIQQYYFQWANRGNGPVTNALGQQAVRKPNIQPAVKQRRQRTAFSTIDKANACTLAQTAAVLGLPAAQIQAIAGGGNIQIVRESSQPDQGATGPADVCLLIDQPLPASAAGIVLDYEVGDGRSAEQTLAFLTRFTAMVRKSGKRSVLLVDPLNAPSQTLTGISADNANRITKLFDRTTIFLWSKNREGDVMASYRAQMAMLAAGGKVDPRRLIIDFDLGGTSVADAKAVRQQMLSDHLAGVILWRDRAVLGGDCDTPPNQKIQCLVFGCA